MCSHFQSQQFGGWGVGMGQWTLQERDWEEFEPVPNNPKHRFSIVGDNYLNQLELVHGTCQVKT